MVAKCSEIKGIAKCATCLYKGAARVTYYTFTPSLLSYFLWSGIIYMSCATFAILEWWPIYDYFCELPAQERGCNSCSDNLLMCSKSVCWQDAVNKTYQAEARDPNGEYFEAMHQAVQDKGCNRLVESSQGPVEMLSRIESSLASGSVTSACRAWNCQVAVRAFRDGEGCSDLCGSTSASEVQALEAFCGVDGAGLASEYTARCSEPQLGQARRASELGAPGVWYDAAWQSEAAARRLTSNQTTSTTFLAQEGSGSGSGGKWVTTRWSSCTCLQQCTAGIRTRAATCSAGQGYCDEGEKPPEVETCECSHCARCTVRWSILGFAWGYYFQGSCSLLLWLAFLRVSYLDEEDLTHISWTMKLLGGVCKILPRLVRSCSLLSFFFIIVLIAQTWLPSGDMNAACKQNEKLQFVSVLIALCWVMQLVIGVYMKRRSPMPAFLYNARKPGMMRVMCRPVRAIGP